MESPLRKAVKKSDSLTWFVIENTWIDGVAYKDTPLGNCFGWGNGYIAIPSWHPWYKKSNEWYDENIPVHGGITFNEFIKGMRVVGFDTDHYNDSLEKWPKERVEKEAKYLFTIADTYPIRKRWTRFRKYFAQLLKMIICKINKK